MHDFTANGPIATAVRMHGGHCQITVGGRWDSRPRRPAVPGRGADRKGAAGTTLVAFDGEQLPARVHKSAIGRPARAKGLVGWRSACPPAPGSRLIAVRTILTRTAGIAELAIDSGLGDITTKDSAAT
jgi:hypothetical protein